MKEQFTFSINTNPPATSAIFISLHPEVKLPVYKTYGSVGCDLYLIEDYSISPGQVVFIRSGLIAIPPTYFYWKAYLRSSIGIRYPGLILTNHVGIIDADYIGPEDELKFALFNSHQDPNNVYFLSKGDRVIQLVLEPIMRPTSVILKTLEEMPNYEKAPSRQGHGTTGK